MKKLFSALLALLLAVGTFGLAESADWMTPYEEPVDIHVALKQSSNQIFFEGEDAYDNLWWKYFREHYNVNVIVDWVAMEKDLYATKMKLAIASGDIPDAFCCYTVQLKQMMEAGLTAWTGILRRPSG